MIPLGKKQASRIYALVLIALLLFQQSLVPGWLVVLPLATISFGKKLALLASHF